MNAENRPFQNRIQNILEDLDDLQDENPEINVEDGDAENLGVMNLDITWQGTAGKIKKLRHLKRIFFRQMP